MQPQSNGLMNDTKWDEIRTAMYEYPASIKWRTKDIESGYISNWDKEWFYHLKNAGYKTIEWLEIEVDNEKIKDDFIKILEEIHVPGEVLQNSIIIYGYKNNEAVSYI